ncbi:MAG: hypothetical protein KC419_03815, partial [Anaerolineales bacterium]|nr:hypothetical protein [Anaerolineales bacterium]
MKHTIIILIIILSVGCQAQRPPTATPTATAVSTPTPLPTSTATTSSPPTTIAETLTVPERQPTRTPRPTLTPFPTAPPTATSPPPLNVTELVEQLAFETIEGENGRSLNQLRVSEYGLRHQYYCEKGPFHWLDNGHLMLFPVVGYTNWYENPTMGQVTRPVIISLDGSDPWAADISPTDVCDLPVWSDALQQVIEAGGGQVRLRDLQGSIIETYDGQMPLFLAPSGRRLLAGFTWIDLTTGETVSLGNNGWVKFPQPAWTTEETRFFECCFGYGDTRTGNYQRRESYPGFWVGGVGVGPGYFGSRSRWVANDALVMIEPSNMSFLDESNQPVVPVIDPEQQTYVDVVEQLGLPDTVVTCGPFIAPDGSAFWLSCSEWKDDVTIQQHDPAFLVMLPSFEAMTVTGKIEFRGWSADSRFMAFTKLADADVGTGTTWLMDT